MKLGRVAVDGTKIKANASKHKAMSYGRMVEKEARLKREVREMLECAEAVDREEDERHGRDRSGEELPVELARRESRLKKIREAKAALEAEAREQARAEGEDPKGTRPPDKAQRNFTDPDSKIQKTSDGFIQGYNAQIAVDAHAQVILAQHVTPCASDVEQMKPAVAAIRRVLRKKPKQLIADAGYWSEDNVRDLEGQKIEPFIATRRIKHSEPWPPAPRGRPPAHLSCKERMQRKLRTKRGTRGVRTPQGDCRTASGAE
ncbi:MAG TPA: transposase [Tepidiformaceae bacterium]|nr:transposase [Tepidiformaceae bacterium]